MQGILKPIGEANEVDSTQNQESKSFRERLMEKFQPHEFVRVINIDTEPFRFQVMPTTKETVQQIDSATQRIWRNPADIFEIPAGESAIIEGWKAYLMIENLYKKMIQKRPEGIKLLTNVALQEKYTNDIFLGVEDPFAPRIEVKPDVEKDLGLDAEPARRGRPPKTAPAA